MKTQHFFKIAYTAVIAVTLLACDPPTDNNRSVPPSTCSISTIAEDHFKYEAAQLAVEQLFAENNPDTSLVFIPNNYYNAYIKTLGLIYDATSIPQRDSVIDKHLICQFNETHGMLIFTSGVLPWVDNWINNIIPTGNATVDGWISSYHLTIDEGSGMGPNPWYIIESDQPLNFIALSHLFETQPGVNIAEPNTYWGVYSKLEASFTGNIAHVIFYEGWGDCPAGCFGYHQWEFDVDVDLCTVTFTGYYP